MSTVRVAMTQTCNVYPAMPSSVEELSILAARLDDVRRANVEHHVELIRAARHAGARVVGLGELFTAPYFALHRDPMWFDLAESVEDGPTVGVLREVAAELQIVIVAPLYERDSNSSERFNTTAVIDADGTLLGSYRKCHIPSGTNEDGTFDESFYYSCSDGRMRQLSERVRATNPYQPVFDTAAGRIGVATCYDRHFEGMMSGLAAAGAKLVFSPAVTFGKQSRRLWEMEFLVDAARNGIYIGGSNRLGSEKPWNQSFFGGSYFAGPNGRCNDIGNRDDLVIADLDFGNLSAPGGSGWDFRRDARPEIHRRG